MIAKSRAFLRACGTFFGFGFWTLLATMIFGSYSVLAEKYSLPEVYVGEVEVEEANRQSNFIEEYLGDIDRRLTAEETGEDDTDARLDTLEADRDTLYSQGDTLHTRIDSLMTRDSVFYAYDNAGEFTLGTNSATAMLLDTEVRKDAIYGHGADKDAVAVSTAGWYEISYAFSVKPASVAHITYAGYLQRYNSGWSTMGGSIQWGKAGDNTNYRTSVSVGVLIELSAGDSIRIIGFNFDLSVNLITEANSVNLRIKKIQ